MKIDPYNKKERFLEWKAKNQEGISGISKINSDLILRHINDMEKGLNVAVGSVKGSRSYSRLVSLKDRLLFFSRKFKELYDVDNLTKMKEEQLVSFFSDMQKGILKRKNGQEFKSVRTYVKDFKSFWHWWMKINKKKDIEIKDITLDLDTRQEKPKWVYLNEEQVRTLCNNARYDYKVLFMFLFDTGIRAPTELMNVKVSDLYNNYKELNIRQETSKTFGRRIKLMICSELLKEYIKTLNLKTEDYLFKINPASVNKYLKRLALKLFGDTETEAGSKYSEISLYDFRHCSCCYWLPRYKSESALKYRFGWKKSDKIHYYSELLGMKDTIAEEDMLIDITKTEIEKRLEKSEKEKELMKEEINSLKDQISQILEITNQLHGQMKSNIQKTRIREIEIKCSNRLENE
jgi:site-specific recombinase XerD